MQIYKISMIFNIAILELIAPLRLAFSEELTNSCTSDKLDIGLSPYFVIEIIFAPFSLANWVELTISLVWPELDIAITTSSEERLALKVTCSSKLLPTSHQ